MPPPPELRVPRRVLPILGALSAFGPFSIDLYLPSTPRIAADLHASGSATSLTVSACLVGLALGQLVAGPLSDSVGRRRPLLIGVALFTLASLGCALAPGIGVLVAIRVLQGLAGAAGLVIARATVRDLYDGPRAARMFAAMMAIAGVAPVVAPVVGAQLLRVISWRGVFVVLAGVGLALLLASATLPETRPAGTRRSGRVREAARVFGWLLRRRPFVAYAATSGFASAALFVYIASAPFVVEDDFGRSAQQFSLIFAVNSAGIALASLVGGRVVHRFGPARLVTVGVGVQTLAAVALFAVAASGHPPLVAVLVPVLLVVSMVGLIGPNITALALAPYGEHAGSASAQLGVWSMLIGAVAGPLAGLGGQVSTFGMAATILVVCVVAAAIHAGSRSAHRAPDLDAHVLE